MHIAVYFYCQKDRVVVVLFVPLQKTRVTLTMYAIHGNIFVKGILKKETVTILISSALYNMLLQRAHTSNTGASVSVSNTAMTCDGDDVLCSFWGSNVV